MENRLTLTIPNTSIDIDITDIARIEHRVQEVSGVSKEKAPELLAAFNRAWLQLNSYLALLEKHLLVASRKTRQVRGRLLLDVIPKALEERGLSTSKDLRDAYLDTDNEYQKALEVEETIQCTIALLRGKQKGIEMAYNSVKKLYSDRQMGPNPWLSAGAESEGQGETP
jgi:hypothetical protein